MFNTPELERVAAERVAAPAFDAVGGIGRANQPTSFRGDTFFSGFDDARVSRRPPGPGDSNYELTFTLNDVEGDSGSEFDAEAKELVHEAPSSDEIPALSPSAASSGAEPWHHRFIESWGLGLIVTTLGLIAISVPVIGYLLWRTLDPGQPPDFPAPTLIAGFACGVGLMMISVPLLLVAASLSELVRDARRRDPLGEDRGLVGRR
jgi:hypothetical protein